MHTNWYTRIFVGLCCAVFLGFITAVVSEARPLQQNVAQQPVAQQDGVIAGDDCASCHEPIMSLWENGRHIHADGFAVGEVGAEAMTCQTCHPSDPAEHPQKLMYTDTSSRLCANCHVSTFDELEISAHGEEGMACIRCHNPHDSGLRAGGVQDTCVQCHRDETHFYTFTDHANEGLLCTDCHLQVKEGPLGEVHKQHTFSVGLETCSECHGSQMHFPSHNHTDEPVQPAEIEVSYVPVEGTENASVQTTTILSSLGDSDLAELNNEPTSTSTINLIVMAAMIGMLFGLIGSPWLEKWFSQARDKEENQ